MAVICKQGFEIQSIKHHLSYRFSSQHPMTLWSGLLIQLRTIFPYNRHVLAVLQCLFKFFSWTEFCAEVLPCCPCFGTDLQGCIIAIFQNLTSERKQALQHPTSPVLPV